MGFATKSRLPHDHRIVAVQIVGSNGCDHKNQVFVVVREQGPKVECVLAHGESRTSLFVK